MEITCDGGNAVILLEKDAGATLYNGEAAETIYAALAPWKTTLTGLTIQGDAVDAEAYDTFLFDLLANFHSVNT